MERDGICREFDFPSRSKIYGLIPNGESRDLMDVLMLILNLVHKMDVLLGNDLMMMIVAYGADLLQSPCRIASHS